MTECENEQLRSKLGDALSRNTKLEAYHQVVGGLVSITQGLEELKR
jgi:hypothetical protein